MYPYRPNRVPPKERFIFIVLSLFLIVYGSYGVLTDDLYIPTSGRRRYSSTPRPNSGMHLHGPAAWCIYLAILCAVACMISMVVDHYDERDNEIKYKQFAQITQLLAVAFMVLGVILHIAW